MPSLINRIPAGIADILGIKATGRSPYILLDEVQGGIDLTEFYLASLEPRYVKTNNNFNAIGSVALYVCPAYMYALVTEASALATTAAANFGSTQLAVRFYGKNDAGATASHDIVVGNLAEAGDAAVADSAASVLANRPMLLRPGDIFLQNCTYANGSVNVAGALRYFVLPI